jgi:hypothetical protein
MMRKKSLRLKKAQPTLVKVMVAMMMEVEVVLEHMVLGVEHMVLEHKVFGSHASQYLSYGAPHSQRRYSVYGPVDDGSHISVSSSYNYLPRRDQNLYDAWAPPPGPIQPSVMYGYRQPPPPPTYAYSHQIPNPTYEQPFYSVTNLDPDASTSFQVWYFYLI